ncbi:MAG: hypothetical protein EA402_10775 [Planctomycetota bacterium]|nr:MAG: hypothetical protein EA402_10775 [Planctomycetota bacterium]
MVMIARSCSTLLSVCLCVASVLPSFGSEAGENPSPNPAQLWALAEAIEGDRRRAQELSDAWRQEQALLQSQAEIYRSSLELAEQRQRQLSERTQRLRAQAEAAEQRREAAAEGLKAWQQAVEALETALQQLAQGSLQPADGAEPSADLLAAWRASLARLEQYERQSRHITTHLRSGRGPDGGTQVVEVLSIGHAAAWWRSLDGEQAGLAWMADGALQLRPLSGSAQAQILRAFRIRRSALPPQFLALPLPPAQEPQP